MRTVFILLFVLCAGLTYGQKTKYLIDLKINKLYYKGDSIVFNDPSIYEIKTSGTSEIVEIGQINDVHLGVQYEILNSQLNNKNSFIAAKVYYIRSGTADWEQIVYFNHSNIFIDKLSDKKENDRKFEEKIKNAKNEKIRQTYLRGNSETLGDPVSFGIYYRINYYMK